LHGKTAHIFLSHGVYADNIVFQFQTFQNVISIDSRILSDLFVVIEKIIITIFQSFLYYPEKKVPITANQYSSIYLIYEGVIYSTSSGRSGDIP